ncbi:MAG: dihydropteroate synthase [Litoreibacter sp.]
MTVYYRAIPCIDPARMFGALPLCSHSLFFDRVERLERGRKPEIIPNGEVPTVVLEQMTAKRAPIAGLDFNAPAIMGVLNVTPDSFSDGGAFLDIDAAVARGRAMVSDGAEIIDIGGESTRPGAATVSAAVEIERIIPVIKALRSVGITVPISVDTRKAQVAQTALDAGATMLNDVSGLNYCGEYANIATRYDAPICLMHAQGDPKTMQDAPEYEDVLLDVYDYLSSRVAAAVQAGVSMDRIVLDPGIGFGKTLLHNMALLRRISLFHTLGCPILLGVSRKRVIGTLTGQEDATKRGPGSAALGLMALNQGVQMLRVHDIEMHKQMCDVWRASRDHR